MIEAVVYGTPVIAFRKGGSRELVADDQTGFLVSDEPAMVKAIGRLDQIDPKALSPLGS